MKRVEIAVLLFAVLPCCCLCVGGRGPSRRVSGATAAAAQQQSLRVPWLLRRCLPWPSFSLCARLRVLCWSSSAKQREADGRRSFPEDKYQCGSSHAYSPWELQYRISHLTLLDLHPSPQRCWHVGQHVSRRPSL